MIAIPVSDVPKPSLSVVIPMHDEAGNVRPLIDEIGSTLRGHIDFEIICVDDASCDATLDELMVAARAMPELRVVRHEYQVGQSTALRTGVKRARANWVVTLDGDGQNDPADIVKMLVVRDEVQRNVDLLAGWRIKRRDTWMKRASSRIANTVRRVLLRDDCPDTGCGLKLFKRDAFLDLPYFDHMHRYLPALFKRAGWQVRHVPVRHRPRLRGYTKYGIGNRLWVGIVDLFGVAWLMRRSHPVTINEIMTEKERGP